MKISMAVATAAMIVCLPVRAQTAVPATSEQQLVDWYYAAFFGTGVYKSGDRTVSVVQIPLSKQLWPASDERFGLTITAPLTFGFYDYRFDQLLGGEAPQSIGTGSLLPGIEADIRVNHGWRLKPYFNVGRGWEWDSGQYAWIHAEGIKSLISLPIGADSTLSFGNQITMSGYQPSFGAYRQLGLFVAGLNLSMPISMKIADHAMSVDYHLLYYYYFTRLRYAIASNTENTISEQGEVAISLHARDPFSLKLFDIDRIGIAFRMGGGITGVRLFMSLPY
jgi:hypothetical protein